jgi:hypothetical protein
MKNFFLTMAKNIGQAVFTVVFISSALFVYAAWNTPVKDGDTLTSTLWNDLVTKVAQLDTNKADKSQLSSYATQSWVNTQISGVSLTRENLKNIGVCAWNFVYHNGVCIQYTLNAGGQTFNAANNHCANTYGGRLATSSEYQSACSAGVLSGTGVWEKVGPVTGAELTIFGEGSCSASYSTIFDYSLSITYSNPFRCVY